MFSTESRLASLNFVQVGQKFPLVALVGFPQRAKVSSEESSAFKYLAQGTGIAQRCGRCGRPQSQVATAQLTWPGRCTRVFPSVKMDWRLGKGAVQNLPNAYLL